MTRIAPEKPDQLAQSAFEVFADRGFKDATVDEIAVKASVTKAVSTATRFLYRPLEREQCPQQT